MDKEVENIERVIETEWEASEGLQAFEMVKYGIKVSLEGERKEISRAWGFKNGKGEIMISPIYSCVWKFQDGISKVCKNGKWGVIDKCGKVVVPIIYQTIYQTSDGMLQVQLLDKWGCLKKDGTTIVEPQYDYIFPFRGAFAGIKDGKKYGFIHLSGKVVIKPCFDEIGQISVDGTVKVHDGTMWKKIVLLD